MPAPEIHIDQIQLDLHGISPAVAQNVLSSFGPALREALVARIAGCPVTASTQIPAVTAPAVRIPAGADAIMIRRALADQLATAIASQLPPAPNT